MKTVEYPTVRRGRERFLEVWYFEAFLKSKEQDKVIKRMFKVHSTSFTSAKQRVERWIEKNLSQKLLECFQIQKHKIKAGIVVKELGIKKNQKYGKDRIDFRRLDEFDHRVLGRMWIANPEQVVAKNIIGREILFWVSVNKHQVELKGFIFSPQLFNLTTDQKKRIFNGLDQERIAELESIKQQVVTLERFCERAMDMDFEPVIKVIGQATKIANKQYTAISAAYAQQIVKDARKLRERSISKNKKVKLNWVDCVRRTFNSDPLYNYDDAETACSILRSQGIILPRTNFMLWG